MFKIFLANKYFRNEYRISMIRGFSDCLWLEMLIRATFLNRSKFCRLYESFPSKWISLRNTVQLPNQHDGCVTSSLYFIDSVCRPSPLWLAAGLTDITNNARITPSARGLVYYLSSLGPPRQLCSPFYQQ